MRIDTVAPFAADLCIHQSTTHQIRGPDEKAMEISILSMAAVTSSYDHCAYFREAVISQRKTTYSTENHEGLFCHQLLVISQKIH